jgi:hypothetical protein
LIDSAGYTDLEDIGSNFNQLKNLMKIPSIRSALSGKIKTDYAANNMADLTHQITDPDVKRTILSIFDSYIEKESKPQIFKATPAYVNQPQQQSDNLTALMKDISRQLREIGTQNTNAAGSQFSFNVGNYVIELSPNEIAELSNVELASLAQSDIEIEQPITRNAVFISDKQYEERYKFNQYPSYTGIDMRVIMMTPYSVTNNMSLKVLSYSAHSGVVPVPVLGRVTPKGFADGDRTVAGSMIGVVTVNDPLFDLQPLHYGIDNYAKGSNDVYKTYLLPDQLPRFDILLMFSNEHGFTSAMTIFGVKLTDIGSVVAMSDSEIEVTYTYTALDMDILRSVAGEVNESGNVNTFDITGNNEYLAKRNMIYSGKSHHRDSFEIGSVYAKIDNRAREIGYNKLRSSGLSNLDIINYEKYLNSRD